jgi:hypothetical protein
MNESKLTNNYEFGERMRKLPFLPLSYIEMPLF